MVITDTETTDPREATIRKSASNIRKRRHDNPKAINAGNAGTARMQTSGKNHTLDSFLARRGGGGTCSRDANREHSSWGATSDVKGGSGNIVES